jgi:uridine phosphorylase
VNKKDGMCPPILAHKHYDAASVFTPENLLREARRQKDRQRGTVPPICVLDPDADIVRRLKQDGLADPHPAWACYHTELYRFTHAGVETGIVGCAVGAAFAVLVAEQLFASGCRFLISVTSAGKSHRFVRRPISFSLSGRCATRERATITHRLPSSVMPMPLCLQR